MDEIIEYASLLNERQDLLKALKNASRGVRGTCCQCEADNLRVPGRCPNPAAVILVDPDDTHWVACDDCATWWYENNAGPDDWEGPPQPEYTESDFEAYDEMVREDRHDY